MVDWLVESQRCPGLFYGTLAQDGFLLRIRTPGGRITQSQGLLLAQLCQTEFATDRLQITNRANLQLRALTQAPKPNVWQQLQAAGLAAQAPELDHLRNLMASPTAGFDRQELLDTLPLVEQLDRYIQTQADWVGLPAKFSIGLDGGGSVGIGTQSLLAWEHRYNDIQFSALAYLGQVYFHLVLANYPTQVLLPPDTCQAVLAAFVQAYLDYLRPLPPTASKPRLRQLLQDWGLAKYLQQANRYLAQPLQPVAELPPLPTPRPHAHLGLQQQCQLGQVYLGISLTLGQLSLRQFVGLLQLSAEFGQGGLRLTPWQTVILPDIVASQADQVLAHLQALGLAVPEANIPGYPPQIVACAGLPGCGSALTHTQAHALALVAQLPATHQPINIHVSGCAKGCAQPSPADLTLLGIQLPISEAYQLYTNPTGLPLRALAEQRPLATLSPAELPAYLEEWLAALRLEAAPA